MTRFLRAIALAIAVGGIVDPAVPISGATRARIAIVTAEPQTAGNERVRAELTRYLGAAFDIVSTPTADSAAAIVVGREYPSRLMDGPFTGSISTVTMPQPNVTIGGISAPRAVPPATTIHLEADIDARDAAGDTTEVVASLGGLAAARSSHKWTRARERWRAALDVVPFGDPPFVLRIQAGASAQDVVVHLRTDLIRVLVHDARPSWASTFARRALESDVRFHVESTVVDSRAMSAHTAGSIELTDARIDAFDAVVVGGLDAMSAADARALDRYMRERGGAVALVPDQRVTRGPAAGFVPDATERLLERPAQLRPATAGAALQATELLLFSLTGSNDLVLQTTPDAAALPVVVSLTRGAGRLLVSGAMDAWRFRGAAGGGFDRFWQSAVAGAALATPPDIDVTVDPPAVRPGARAVIIVSARGVGPAAKVAATLDDRPIRLWPEPQRRTYRAEFIAAPVDRRSTVRVVVDDGAVRTASHTVLVRADARRDMGTSTAPLALLAASHRGIDVGPDRVAALVRFLRDTVAAPRQPRTTRPMRSPWWIVPFAGCLSAEWWLRRRRGLR